MIFSRRNILSAASCLPALAVPVWVSTPAKAQVEYVVAAVALISAVIDLMQKSGDMALEFEALNLKLDQILTNQRLLLQAIDAINISLNDIQRSIAEAPSETVTLQAVINANTTLQLTTQSIQSLEKRAADRQARSEYNQYRQRLFETSAELISTAQTTYLQPSAGVGIGRKARIELPFIVSEI
jgi:hypothetical protein